MSLKRDRVLLDAILLAVKSALRTTPVEEEVNRLFLQSCDALKQLLRVRPVSESVATGVTWVNASRFVHPIGLLPDDVRSGIQAEPEKLVIWQDLENLGLSLAYEGLRYGVRDPLKAADEPFPIERSRLLLRAHRWARYLKDLAELDDRDRERLRAYEKAISRSRRRTFMHQVAMPHLGSPGLLLWDWASLLESYLQKAEERVDDLYAEAYGVRFSDVLRFGVFLLRLASLEQRRQILPWPLIPLESEQAIAWLETLAQSRQIRYSIRLKTDWFTDVLPLVMEHLTLWHNDPAESQRTEPVYDYLRNHPDMSIFGFQHHGRRWVVLQPLYTGVSVFHLPDWLQHDGRLDKLAKEKRHTRNLQRWVDFLEKVDLTEWRKGLLDRIRFEWVETALGTFRLGKRQFEIDALCLMQYRNSRVLLVGEAKRWRATFFPKDQLDSMSKTEEALAQSREVCAILQDSIEARTLVERRTGKRLGAIGHFQHFALIPHIPHFRKGEIVLWADDTPLTARRKIAQALDSRLSR